MRILTWRSSAMWLPACSGANGRKRPNPKCACALTPPRNRRMFPPMLPPSVPIEQLAGDVLARPHNRWLAYVLGAGPCGVRGGVGGGVAGDLGGLGGVGGVGGGGGGVQKRGPLPRCLARTATWIDASPWL